MIKNKIETNKISNIDNSDSPILSVGKYHVRCISEYNNQKSSISITTLPNMMSKKTFKDTNIMMINDEDYDFEGLSMKKDFYIAPPSFPSLDLKLLQSDIYNQSEKTHHQKPTEYQYFSFLLIGVVSFFIGRNFKAKKASKLQYVDPIQSLEDYDKYLEYLINEVERVNNIGDYSRSLKLIKNALYVAYNNRFRSIQDPGTLYHLRANTHIKFNNLKAALNDLTAAFEIYDNSLGISVETANVLEDMGSLLEQMGNFEDAKTAFQKSVRYLENLKDINSLSSKEEILEYTSSLMKIVDSKESDTEEDDLTLDKEVEDINHNVLASNEVG